MVYQFFRREDGKFSHALKDGATVFVRDFAKTARSPHPDYDPATHRAAASFLDANPDLADLPSDAQKPDINWDGAIDGLVTSADFWNIIGRYQGLNLSPRKQLSGTATCLMLVRLPGVLSQFITSWNGIITEIRGNVLVVKPTVAEIAAINAILNTNYAPFRMDAQGFFVMR